MLETKISIFKTLYDSLKEVGNLRNAVVHADWESAHTDGYTLYKLKVDSNGFQHEYIQFSVDSLNKVLDLIDHTCELFEKYDDEWKEYFSQH